jgi:uncharacterized SAM-binding protein YcdF (DUF218 family)
MRLRLRPVGRITVIFGFLLIVGLILWQPLARGVAQVLIVDEPLQKAAAIVVLQGGPVFRDSEAAAAYHGGWAPKVVISRDVPPAHVVAARQLGFAYPINVETSLYVLHARGVPDEAVVVLPGVARTTVEELANVFMVLGPGEEPLIVVTSPTHTRRVGMLWRRIAGTSRPLILRFTRSDPFDPNRWWQDREQIVTVLREYLSLANLLLGSPTRSISPSPSS